MPTPVAQPFRRPPRWSWRVRAGLVALPVGAALFLLARRFPGAVESLYATGVYPLVASVLARASSLVPFSIAEPVAVILTIVLIASPIAALRRRPVPQEEAVLRHAEAVDPGRGRATVRCSTCTASRRPTARRS